MPLMKRTAENRRLDEVSQREAMDRARLLCCVGDCVLAVQHSRGSPECVRIGE